MVLASHVILTAYGFWLPNDPRGSWSAFVGAWELLRFGRASKVDTRRSVANRPHDHAARQAAKGELKYPPVAWTGVQARAVARGFAAYAAGSGVVVHACSILPEHVHLVLARHRVKAGQLARLFKAAATSRLLKEKRHPLADFPRDDGRLPTPWARGRWVGFLDTPQAVRRAIRYVQGNPVREGLPPQRWRFVTPYDG